MSAGGRPYLRGWAGASNLVAFRGEPDEQGRATWNLYLTERQPRAGKPNPRSPARAGEAPAARGAPSRREGAGTRQEQAAREVVERHGAPELDDAPF